jgi:hypothetical protein
MTTTQTATHNPGLRQLALGLPPFPSSRSSYVRSCGQKINRSALYGHARSMAPVKRPGKRLAYYRHIWCRLPRCRRGSVFCEEKSAAARPRAFVIFAAWPGQSAGPAHAAPLPRDPIWPRSSGSPGPSGRHPGPSRQYPGSRRCGWPPPSDWPPPAGGPPRPGEGTAGPLAWGDGLMPGAACAAKKQVAVLRLRQLR